MTADPTRAFQSAVLQHLGYAPEIIEPGRLQRFSTSERRSDSAGWCKLFEDLRGGVFGCYRQGVSETWFGAERTGLTDQERSALRGQIRAAIAERAAEQHRVWRENAIKIAALWKACRPIEKGDPAGRYLARRGFASSWPLPNCLRVHPKLTYWEAGRRVGTFPCMVAPVTRADGMILALHRTYLTSDGRKAPVPTVRKLTGAAGPLAGASIPLHSAAGGTIGIAEGIETALAATAASGVPTVAAYSAGNLAAWRWPTDTRNLVIFADADPAGQDAASKLLARAEGARLKASVLAPSTAGQDWADVWATVATQSEEAKG